MEIFSTCTRKLLCSCFCLLFIFKGVQMDGADPSTCPGLYHLANAIQNLPSRVSKNVQLTCKVASDCSALDCSGTIFGKSSTLSLKMEHCTPPMSMELTLKVPSSKVDIKKELVDKKETRIAYEVGIGELRIAITPNFHREGDIVTAKFEVCGSFALTPKIATDKCSLKFPLATTFNIKKELCGGSAVPRLSTTQGPEPERTTGAEVPSSPSKQESTPMRPTTSRMLSTKKHMISTGGKGETTRKGMSHTTGMPHTTERHQTTKRMHSTGVAHSTGKIRTTQRPGRHGKGKKGKSKGLSTGGKVAIISSAALIFLVVIALFLYCRRLKQRRPAFYNDIAINDPLRGDMYEGDEEPLFNSHLVL